MTAILQPYLALMRLNKPIGIFLLLWPTLIALWLASDGTPDFGILSIFCAGVVIMRSSGCVINDYADRNYDPQVERTKNRPLATKQIRPANALILFVLLLSIAFILVLQLNLQVILLSVVAATLAIIYPFSKRFSRYPQIILGLAFAWSIPMVYMQVQQRIPVEAWVVLASTMCWVVAYDTVYAMADKTDDLKIGIKSTAITFGKYAKQIVFALHCSALLGFVYVGINRNAGISYYICLAMAFGLALYQQFQIKTLDPKRCFAAFLNNNWFGALLFVACARGWML